MIYISVKEAKKTYVETGRLNRNIIDKEVAISWYKCKLQNMQPSDKFKIYNEDVKNPFDSKFLNYVDSIVSDHYQYVIANKSLQVCAKRIEDQQLSKIQSIDDLTIGTNGGYISQKNHSIHQVYYEEHYLEILTKYCTCGINLADETKTYGTLMLISSVKIDEYETFKLNDQLAKYYNKEEYDVINDRKIENTSNKVNINDVLAFPENYLEEFVIKLGKITKMGIPIVIRGDKGTGKTTLASYLLLNTSGSKYTVTLSNANKRICSQLIENALFHNDTVLIENVEYISEDAIQLLTVYTDSILNKESHEKYSNYKCFGLILTTVNTKQSDRDIPLQSRLLSKLLDKFAMSTVNLVNSTVFASDYSEIVDKISKRYPYEMTSNFRNQVKVDLETKNFKDSITNIEISMNNVKNIESKALIFHVNDSKEIPKTLQEVEFEHIEKVYQMMEKNIAATADVLEIGRTTLYRKLEKMKVYQNETK